MKCRRKKYWPCSLSSGEQERTGHCELEATSQVDALEKVADGQTLAGLSVGQRSRSALLG